ncbi:hypothetical protein [Actinomyces urinae]|uniref:hypothetical protein n=1 Tax=Actinomyces urinae TaxID=1689268 RepID=UPI001177DF6D|nr:hypothetical protein [Actinomyces urinae]
MRRKILHTRLLAMGAAIVLPLSLATPALAAPDLSMGSRTTLISTTFAGDIQMVRYEETPSEAAIATSIRQFNQSAKTVYLINPFEDGGAATIAGAPKSQRPGPVLFTEKNGELSERTLLEIARLCPETVVVVGEGVAEQAGAVARSFAQTARDNSNALTGQVELLTWQGESAEATSNLIAQATYSKGAKRVYLVGADDENKDALAAIAGTMGDGPVLLVSKDHVQQAKQIAASLKPDYVVGIGTLDPKLVDGVAGAFRKSSISGSVKSVALNAATARKVEKNSVTAVAAQDDPASLILAAESASGPLIPLPANTSEAEAVATVLMTNKLTEASSKRFVAFGEKGLDGKLFNAVQK